MPIAVLAIGRRRNVQHAGLLDYASKIRDRLGVAVDGCFSDSRVAGILSMLRPVKCIKIRIGMAHHPAKSPDEEDATAGVFKDVRQAEMFRNLLAFASEAV